MMCIWTPTLMNGRIKNSSDFTIPHVNSAEVRNWLNFIEGTKYDRKYNKSGNFWGDGEGETGRRDKFEEEAFRNFE